MIIRTTVHGNGIHCTLVSTEESISTDIKALVKAKLIKWHEDEPADKKAWKYRGYSMHWDKGRETWVMMKDGYEEWDAVTVGEVKEWIDGAKGENKPCKYCITAMTVAGSQLRATRKNTSCRGKRHGANQ